MSQMSKVAEIMACNLPESLKEEMIASLFQTGVPAKVEATVEQPKDGVLPPAKDVPAGSQMTGRKYPKKGSAHVWESARRTSDGGAYWKFVS